MSENPYAPPGAKVRDGEGRGTRRSPLLAVLIGWAVDVLGTLVFGTIIAIVAAVALAASGGGESDLRGLQASAGWQIISFVVGFGFTALGGYVTARIVNHQEYRWAALTGLASLVTGEVLSGMSPDGEDAWLRILSWLLSIPVALAGAWVHLQRKPASHAH